MGLRADLPKLAKKQTCW